jgi:hypothetical protein
VQPEATKDALIPDVVTLLEDLLPGAGDTPITAQQELANLPRATSEGHPGRRNRLVEGPEQPNGAPKLGFDRRALCRPIGSRQKRYCAVNVIFIHGVAPLRGHVGRALTEDCGEIVGKLVIATLRNSPPLADLSCSQSAGARQADAGRLARGCNQVRLKEVSGAWRASLT